MCFIYFWLTEWLSFKLSDPPPEKKYFTYAWSVYCLLHFNQIVRNCRSLLWVPWWCPIYKTFFGEFGQTAFAREKWTNVSTEAYNFERVTVILLKFNCTQTIKEESVQMCCFFRFFLSHSFSNQSENCLPGPGSKCCVLPSKQIAQWRF